MNVQQGKKLIKLARDSISSSLSGSDLKVSSSVKNEFSEVLGVFVTLSKNGELRGCIGFPEGIYPVYEGVVKAANSAAFSDPRFPPLGNEEFKDISIEVSVLTKPERIIVKNASDYVKEVKVGRDGLIIRSGLLLPQVATEYKWNSKEFLEHTCMKAGLPTNSWKEGNVEVYRFQSMVFSESSPKGEVKQLM